MGQAVKLYAIVDETTPIDMSKTMAETEKCFVTTALEISQGNRARAAKMLMLKRTTLVEKMRKFEIPLLPPLVKGSKLVRG